MTTAIAPLAADKTAFAQCFNRLAKAKRAKDIDAADLHVYYTVVGVYPLWAIEEAARELMITATFGFPTTDVWVTQIQAEIARRDRDALLYQRVWRDECARCRDTGWFEQTCTHTARCGRPFCVQLGEKHTHPYYSACVCRPTNATYQRHTRASQLGRGQGVTR